LSVPSNRRIVLASRPTGSVTPECFRLEEVPLEEPGQGELTLRTLWLSLDPYMRGRMSEAPSYAAPVAIGAVMTGESVARVEKSLHPDFRTGDLVVAGTGWQEYARSDGRGLVRLPPEIATPSHALGVLGMPGFTAYVGLLDIGKPQPKETLVVAAATGAVGSVVGQIAKLKGCRVVGVAGGADKCAWAVQHLGFDACIDHRCEGFGAALAAACPQGVDIYYENVGGRVFRAVWPLLNAHARVPVCGLISQYTETASPVEGTAMTAFMRSILVKRISMRGFIISDGYDHRRGEFLESMSVWLRDGTIKYREDVIEGLENAPAAFVGLLAGRNFGKLLIKLGTRGS
jgi:NADPH-dependent curcumin reductase